MGRALNVDKLTKAQFKKRFTDMMKADDAELCYALVFSADRKWVTVLTEESSDTRKEAA